MKTNNFTRTIIEAFCGLISVNYEYHRQSDVDQLHLMVMAGHYMVILMDAKCTHAVQWRWILCVFVLCWGVGRDGF
jgi:hypothetical protein